MRVESPLLDIIAPPHAQNYRLRPSRPPEERPGSLPSPPLPRSNYPFLWRPFQTELKRRARSPGRGLCASEQTRPLRRKRPVLSRRIWGMWGEQVPAGSGPRGQGARMPTGAHTLSPSARIPGASAAQEEQASCA